MYTHYSIRLLSLLSITVLLIPHAGNAAIVGRGGEDVVTYVLPADTIIYDDFYAGNEKVSLFGSVEGDAFVAAQDVVSAGFVEQDAFFVGVTVLSRGEVGDDLRIIAAQADVETPIMSDVVFVGGELTVAQTAPIAGGVLAAGDRITIRGDVSGDIKIFGNSVYIDSFVGGSVKVFAQEKVTFGPRAQVVGDVVWMGRAAPIVDEGAFVLGSIRQSSVGELIPDGKPRSLRVVSLFAATQALAALFFLFVFGFFSPYGMSRFISRASTMRTLARSALIGIVGGLLLFMVGLILLFSIAGTMVGIVLLLTLALLCVWAIAGANVLLGKALFVLVVRKQDGNEPLWKLVFAGVVGMLLLSAVPIIGPLIFVFFFLAAFGGALQGINALRKDPQPLVITSVQ